MQFEQRSRQAAVTAAAEAAGLTAGARDQIGARIPSRLLAAAKTRTGLSSNTDVLEYALAKVALEDDFGPRLLALKGSIPDDIELEL